MLRQCASCHQDMQKLWENDDDDTVQYDNALIVSFDGGYGMFVDNIDYEMGMDNPYATMICHECAHQLCTDHPWISNLIQPYYSHAHRQALWKHNPDHEGWDNPAYTD